MTAFPFLHDVHAVGHSVSTLLSGDYHWSIHFITHFVLFGVPAALLAATGLPAVEGARRLIRWARRRRRGGRRNSFSLDPQLLAFIVVCTRGRQVGLIVWAAASLPVLYLTLELPKLIINNAIESDHFPVEHFGVALDQITLLAILCGGFLAAVGLNGFLKYQVNVKTGRVAEVFARRLRLLVYRAWRRGCCPSSRAELS